MTCRHWKVSKSQVSKCPDDFQRVRQFHQRTDGRCNVFKLDKFFLNMISQLLGDYRHIIISVYETTSFNKNKWANGPQTMLLKRHSDTFWDALTLKHSSTTDRRTAWDFAARLCFRDRLRIWIPVNYEAGLLQNTGTKYFQLQTTTLNVRFENKCGKDSAFKRNNLLSCATTKNVG